MKFRPQIREVQKGRLPSSGGGNSKTNSHVQEKCGQGKECLKFSKKCGHPFRMSPYTNALLDKMWRKELMLAFTKWVARWSLCSLLQYVTQWTNAPFKKKWQKELKLSFIKDKKHMLSLNKCHTRRQCTRLQNVTQGANFLWFSVIFVLCWK